MDKKELELRIESLKKLEKRKLFLEQYETPSNIVADVIFIAIDDIYGKLVADLGCGNGAFSVAASLMGAREVHCVEIDEDAVKIAMENIGTLNIKIHNMDVRDFNIKVDTIIMNPPFGYQMPHADRDFIVKAMEISNTVYLLHHKGAINYVKSMIASKGEIDLEKDYKFNLPYGFKFHRNENEEIEVKLIRIRVK